MALKPDQIRTGVKVWGIAPKPHILQIGDVKTSPNDHKFYGIIIGVEPDGIIISVEPGERQICCVALVTKSVEQKMFDVTDEWCYADELNFHDDMENRTRRQMDREIIDYCDKCSNHHEKVGVIRRLELPGGAGMNLCRRDWRVEMDYRKERNKDLGRECQYPIVEWEE